MPSATSSSSSSVTQCQRPKSQKCTFTVYECTQKCIDGYAYCHHHILNDPNAPYKQCAFVYNTNGRKCYNSAAKLDRRDSVAYCPEHTRKAQIARIRSTSRHTLPPSPELMLLSLSHYSKPDEDEDDSNQENKVLDPFSKYLYYFFYIKNSN